MTINNRNFNFCFNIPCYPVRHQPVPISLFRNIHVCVFVFDLSNKLGLGLYEIENFWFREFENAPKKFLILHDEKQAQQHKNIIRALVGSKCDLSQKIDDSEIIDCAKTINAKYFKVSAKTGEGINELFDYLITTFCELKKQNENKNEIIKLGKNNEEKKKFC